MNAAGSRLCPFYTFPLFTITSPRLGSTSSSDARLEGLRHVELSNFSSELCLFYVKREFLPHGRSPAAAAHLSRRKTHVQDTSLFTLRLPVLL